MTSKQKGNHRGGQFEGITSPGQGVVGWLRTLCVQILCQPHCGVQCGPWFFNQESRAQRYSFLEPKACEVL